MAVPSYSSDISPLESGEEGVWGGLGEGGESGKGWERVGSKDEEHVANMKNGRRGTKQ